MFMPGYFYNVPVTFDTTAKTAILKTESPIGHAISTNGTGVKNIYYMFNSTADGLTRNPSFSVTTTDNGSVISAKSDLFLGYDANGAGSYNGLILNNVKFDIDYNIFTQEVTEDPYADPTSATVDGITTMPRQQRLQDVSEA